jgi:cytochrome P450
MSSLATLPPLALNPVPRRVPMRAGFPVFRGSYPLLGHMPAIASDYLGLMRGAAEQVGPMFWIDLGFQKSALHVMQPEAMALFKHRAVTSTHFGELLGELFGKSIIAQDGASHQRARSAMNPAFQPRGITASELGSVFADTIERRIRNWPARGEMALLAELRELVLSLMFRMLGVPESEMRPWREQYADLMLLALRVPFDFPGSPLRRGRRARAWLNERLLGFIRDARRNPDAPGLITLLAHATDEQGEPLSDEELADNLRLLVLAGHETTASTLSWMISKLAEHPDAWERLCQEARAAGAAPRTPKEVRSFPYAEAIFREALRLYPPVHIDSRRSQAEVEFCGARIPAGTDITIPIIHLSRHPAFHERPDEFVPERWLARNEALSQLELVQFGAGPHFCLGYHVAWMEVVQVAVTLALVMSERGLRPHLPGGTPALRYLPLLHPSSKATVRFV